MSGAYVERVTPRPRSSLGATCFRRRSHQVRSSDSQSYAASTTEMASNFINFAPSRGDPSPQAYGTKSGLGHSHLPTGGSPPAPRGRLRASRSAGGSRARMGGLAGGEAPGSRTSSGGLPGQIVLAVHRPVEPAFRVRHGWPYARELQGVNEPRRDPGIAAEETGALVLVPGHGQRRDPVLVRDLLRHEGACVEVPIVEGRGPAEDEVRRADLEDEPEERVEIAIGDELGQPG